MTILFQDGFDLYTTAIDIRMQNYFGSTNGTIGLTSGRFGGGSYELQGGQLGIWQNVGTQTDLWLSAAVKVNSTSAGDAVLATFGTDSSTSNGSENQITYNASTGVLKLWTGGYLGSVSASVTKALSNGWHWFDIHLLRSATVGVFELWIDDVQLANLTGANTEHFPSNNMIYAGFGDSAAGTTPDVTIDDLFIYTGSRLGDSRIETTLPTSDATPNQGTPSTGTSHYSVVGEAQFNTSDYITMPNTSGDKEVYGHGSIVSTPATVHAVRVVLVSEKSDAGAYALEPLVISSTTEGDGSSQPLLTTWAVQSSIFEVDPHTSAAWTYAAANASDIGYKVP